MSRSSEYNRITFEPEYDLSIDGRDLSYRDPNNPDMRRTLVDSSDEEYEANPHAYGMTNALYDYSYGEIRKAGQALGIKNVDEPEEVEEMLAYMAKPSAMEEAKEEQMDEAVEPETTTPLTDELADKDAPLSEEVQAATDFLAENVAAIRDGIYNDSYRRTPSGTGFTPSNAPSNETYGSQALDTQIKNATTAIDVDNFSRQRAEINKKIEEEFLKKLYQDNSLSSKIS